MTKFNLQKLSMSVGALSIALGAIATTSQSAQAAPTVFFDDLFTGASEFDSLVNAVNGDLTIDTWLNLPSGQTSIDRGDYSFSMIDGSIMFPSNYNLFGANPSTPMSGEVIDISPSSRDPILSRQSGIEFTFDNVVNGFGLEVGDWATCCQPSALYISFDNGAPIQVGLSTVFGDQFLTNGGAGVFVGAIDDSDQFSSVQFWGDGLGEFLVAGGQIRFATVEEGVISATSVPEPASLLGLLTVGIFGANTARRKKAVS